MSSEPPAWGSCKIITPNLEKAYRNLFKEEADYFSFTAEMTSAQTWILAQEIYRAQPDRLVFLDHMPHPGSLLKALGQLYGKRALPPLYVHVYGDFTLYSKAWLEQEELLKRTRVQFICASRRQMQLVSKFMVEPEDSVRYCPFPVDGKFYSSDPALRAQWREKLGLAKDELAILYTGRISLQKNSIRLASEFLRFANSTDRPTSLLLAGSFDDLGAPFFGVELKKGFYFQQWNGYVQGLNEADRARIRYLGNFGASVLRGLYNAADVYFSLSLHHDEDYGMSPAEALCCGTACVLSDWGGYASFVLPEGTEGAEQAAVKEAVQLIPVSLSAEGVAISSGAAVKALRQQAAADLSEEGRIARSQGYLSWLSVEAATERIAGFHAKPPGTFEGFNWLMRRHADSISGPVLFPAGPKKGTFYEEIYGAYIQG